MSRKRRTRPAEAWKSQSRDSRQVTVSSSSSGFKSPAASWRSSTSRAGCESESAAMTIHYTQLGAGAPLGCIRHGGTSGFARSRTERQDPVDGHPAKGLQTGISQLFESFPNLGGPIQRESIEGAVFEMEEIGRASCRERV